MAKPDSWRLNPASYPFSAPTQTRFGDMDILGHLNNVAYAAQFENGRVRFNRAMDERRNRAEVTAGWSQQLRSITSAKDISPMMLRLHAGLAGDRAGTAAMTVTKNWRLTFRVSEHHALIDLDLEDYR